MLDQNIFSIGLRTALLYIITMLHVCNALKYIDDFNSILCHLVITVAYYGIQIYHSTGVQD